MKHELIFEIKEIVYIGKESDKHWEEGEDMSLLDFTTIEYKRKGNAVATAEQLARIAQVGFGSIVPTLRSPRGWDSQLYTHN